MLMAKGIFFVSPSSPSALKTHLLAREARFSK